MCFYFCSVWSKHTDPQEDKENANSEALNKRPKTEKIAKGQCEWKMDVSEGNTMNKQRTCN